MAMTNMKLSPDEAKDANACCVSDSEGGPAYPYGLSLNLTDEVLKKLGIKNAPAVGEKMMLMATVEVTGTSQYENQKGKDTNVNLQITDMELSGDGSSAADRLYGKENG
mgnify:CR=1 FL=1|tara:strand:+ start:447008 stop:447334 length:327 start_codon:yes stop_codon:yes gene_type:complete